jgi:hypothetical protein
LSEVFTTSNYLNSVSLNTVLLSTESRNVSAESRKSADSDRNCPAIAIGMFQKPQLTHKKSNTGLDLCPAFRKYTKKCHLFPQVAVSYKPLMREHTQIGK